LSAALTSLAASQTMEAQLVSLLAHLGVAFHDEGAQQLRVLQVHGMSFRDGSTADAVRAKPGEWVGGRSAARSTSSFGCR